MVIMPMRRSSLARYTEAGTDRPLGACLERRAGRGGDWARAVGLRSRCGSGAVEGTAFSIVALGVVGPASNTRVVPLPRRFFLSWACLEAAR